MSGSVSPSVLSSASVYSVTFEKASKDDKAGVSFKRNESGIYIKSIKPDSLVADNCPDLKPGDKVLSIDGTSTEDLSAKESANLIRESMGRIEIVAEGPMKTITVFGANGGCGKEFVKIALEADYKVKAFVRNASTYEYADHENVEVVEGDATNVSDVMKATAGADIVASFLGSNSAKPIIYDSHNNIMAAAANMTPPPRCIMISSVGMGDSSIIIGSILQMIGGKEKKQDYEKAEKSILDRDANEVPYIVVRPYALTDADSASYQIIKGDATFAWSISRKAVAKCFLDYAGEDGDEFVGKAVNIGG